MVQNASYTFALTRWHVASVLLMATGWGWINGNFVQPVASGWGAIADGFHLLPFIALLWLTINYFHTAVVGKRPRGSRLGITIVAIFSILACAVFVLAGVTNPDPNSVGVHTFEDAMPVIVLVLGTLLWIATLFRKQPA